MSIQDDPDSMYSISLTNIKYKFLEYHPTDSSKDDDTFVIIIDRYPGDLYSEGNPFINSVLFREDVYAPPPPDVVLKPTKNGYISVYIMNLYDIDGLNKCYMMKMTSRDEYQFV